MGKQRKQPDPGFGVIERGAVYGLAEFRYRTGLGDAALRRARRAGLRIFYEGGKGFVSGDEWLDYLARQAQSKQRN